MRIRAFCVGVITLLVPAVAQAHDHRMDLFLGYCDALESSNRGLHGAAAWALPHPTTHDLSVVVDLSGHFWHSGPADRERPKFVGSGGLRYTFDWSHATQRFIPSVHVLVGVIDTNQETDPAVTFGGGLEYRWGAEPGVAGVGVRFQGDLIVRGGEKTPRLSIGIVKAFPKN